MTQNELIQKRKEAARRLFHMETELFLKTALSEQRGGDCAPDESIRARVGVEEHSLFGRDWFRLYSKEKGAGRAKWLLLDLHGGGFVMETGAAQYDFAAYLIERADLEVWFPAYPLAPEQNCINALEMTLALYRMMLDGHAAEHIVFLGDSAGASLALATAMAAREAGLSQPANLVLLSPATDLSPVEKGEELAWLHDCEGRDELMGAVSITAMLDAWRGDLSPCDWCANPGAGDLTRLAPITMFSGTAEVLNLCARRVRDRAQKQGAPLMYIEKLNAQHNWVVLDPEHAAPERALLLSLFA